MTTTNDRLTAYAVGVSAAALLGSITTYNFMQKRNKKLQDKLAEKQLFLNLVSTHFIEAIKDMTTEQIDALYHHSKDDFAFLTIINSLNTK